eukprot:CAMPEP_0170540844 /NCGR_PEP_ID=MMETSP0211-20121228/768_1 /TAXON_ID=311385 /ORGANISM="Pseudokeronopsis sp., Strain OXSARD2" /LENGTH=97 /DNA_ID=CAMNT_0010843385 /DNA_START=20 /DNA_END=313 /DNA_ORIENTATION=+
MESTNKQEGSALCKNCQTFYGTHNTNFLCSTCFKQLESSNQQAVALTQEKASVAPFKVFSDVEQDLIFKNEPIKDEIMKEEDGVGLVKEDEKLEPAP